MRNIVFHKETKTFHLYNEEISYIMCVLENGHMGQLYYGKRIHDKPDFSYLVEKCGRPMTSYIFEGDRSFSLEHIRKENIKVKIMNILSMEQQIIDIRQLKLCRKMEVIFLNLSM